MLVGDEAASRSTATVAGFSLGATSTLLTWAGVTVELSFIPARFGEGVEARTVGTETLLCYL